MKRKFLALAMSGLLAISTVLFGGCTENTADTADSSAAQEESTTQQVEAVTLQADSTTGEGTQNGILQSIDVENSQVSIAIMDISFGGDMQQPSEMPTDGGTGDGQQAPEKPTGGDSTDGQQPPEMPTGTGDGQQPSEMPTGGDSTDGQQPPEMPTGTGDGQQPSEMPTGGGTGHGQQPSEMPTGMGDGQQPSEMPTGMGDGQQPSEMPTGMGDGQTGFGDMEATTYTVTNATVITDAEGNSVDLSALSEKSMVSFTAEGETLLTLTVTGSFSDMGGNMGGNMDGNMGNPGGGSSAPTEYSAQNHYTEDATETSLTQSSTGTDESIAWVSGGATVTLSDVTADRTSSDSTGGDNASFYGVGAAYLVTDGTLNISGSTITTDAAGGAGVFAYGTGVANVSDTVITTNQGTSGGIHVAGGGTLNAENLTVETYGESSAAIRSDRGSGTMTVNGGTYTSNGTGSPAVYSTADITVSDAVLTANGSEAVCIEGKNSLKLTNCDVTSNMPDNDQNDCKWSVILYQSMSGDSEVGNSVFEMTDGSLTSNAGGLFYTTNTASSFTLQSVEIITSGTPDFFLKCTGNSNARGWGSSGSNGAQCTFTAVNQQMTGDIIWDSISTLDLLVSENSTLQGAVVQDESNAGNGGTGYANVTIDRTSVWIVTGDSTVTTLINLGMIVDEQGNTVTVVGTDGTVYVQGDSAFTVTVQSYN